MSRSSRSNENKSRFEANLDSDDDFTATAMLHRSAYRSRIWEGWTRCLAAMRLTACSSSGLLR